MAECRRDYIYGQPSRHLLVGQSEASRGECRRNYTEIMFLQHLSPRLVICVFALF